VNQGIYTCAGTGPGRIDDGHRQHAVCAQGRALAKRDDHVDTRGRRPCARAPATDRGRPRFGSRPFTLLAQIFGGPVYGVESSVRMRAVAEQAACHPTVTYLDGRAGQIPLPACDLVARCPTR